MTEQRWRSVVALQQITPKARRLLAASSAGVAALAIVVLITHFRFYYGVAWPKAIKWGVGDGFLWGVLFGGVVWMRLRLADRLRSEQRIALFFALSTLVGVLAHPTISTLMFWAIDGSISRPFVADVAHLAMKRLPQGVLAGAALGAAALLWIRLLPSAHDRKTDGAAPAADDHLTFQSAGAIHRIAISDIIFMEAAANYVSIFTQRGEVLERATLTAMEERLAPQAFFRASRKHLINLTHVRTLRHGASKTGEAVMSNDVVVAVSRNRKKALRERLADLTNG